MVVRTQVDPDHVLALSALPDATVMGARARAWALVDRGARRPHGEIYARMGREFGERCTRLA